MPVIWGLGRQEDCKFEASLSYTGSPCLPLKIMVPSTWQQWNCASQQLMAYKAEGIFTVWLLRNRLLSPELSCPAASGFLLGKGPECPLGISPAHVHRVLLGTEHGGGGGSVYPYRDAKQAGWGAYGGGTEWWSGCCSYVTSVSATRICEFSEVACLWLCSCATMSNIYLFSDFSAQSPQTLTQRGRPSLRGIVRVGL